jgi:hypothetical protein
MSKNKNKRPEYIIKVDRDWRYGRHARFWEIQRWYGTDEKGYWSSACRGGLAYTEWGMRLAIKRKLKKMKIGNATNHFDLNWNKIQEPK